MRVTVLGGVYLCVLGSLCHSVGVEFFSLTVGFLWSDLGPWAGVSLE